MDQISRYRERNSRLTFGCNVNVEQRLCKLLTTGDEILVELHVLSERLLVAALLRDCLMNRVSLQHVDGSRRWRYPIE